MTVEGVFEMGLIEDGTEVWIRGEGMRALAHGNWYQDDMLGYGERDVESFTWQDDGKIFIDIKQTECP